jgi:CHAT domain-containing protein/Tfp pilus assembly protein PilF
MVIAKSRSQQLLRAFLLCCCAAFVVVDFCVIQTASTTPATKIVRPADQKDNEAEQAMARAEALRGTWTQASLRLAITEYDQAAQVWTAGSEFSHASSATLKSGDVYFLFGEFVEALKRYDTAKALGERADDWLAKAMALSHSARLQTYMGRNDLGYKYVTEAVELFKQHESNLSDVATTAYAEALSNLAEVTYAKGDFVNTAKQLESAVKLFQNNREGQAKIHLFRGYLTGSIGNPDKAAMEINSALDLYRTTKNKDGEGLALVALGLSYSFRGESKAIALHDEAIEIFHDIGDKNSEAIALNALGQAYENLKNYPIALDYYQKSLKLFQELGGLDGVSMSLFKVAAMHFLMNRPEEALAYYERCLQLSRNAGKARTEALAITEMARIFAAQGHSALARQYFLKAQKFYERINDLRGLATVLNAHGDFLFTTGQKQSALAQYNQALPLSERIGDKEFQIATLFSLARAHRDLGSLELALSFIQRSLNVIEELRAGIENPDFRSSYFSEVQEPYKLCTDILMQLDRLHPGQGFAEQALLTSERGRARLLVDLVSGSRAAMHEGAATELFERERELRGLFRSQVRYRLELSQNGAHPAEIAAVEKEITRLRSDYQQVQAQLRTQQPGLTSFQQSIPQRMEQIQNELRDGHTMLLEYSLGRERSYLWAITSDSSQSYELPPASTIEELAREFAKALSARQDNRADIATADRVLRDEAARLSQVLLAPLGEKLGNKRLLIAADGALQLISFEALPVPGNTEKLLIETNEVDLLPSASTLTAIRNARNHTGSPNKLVAIIADPVFGANDDRVQREPPASNSALAATTNQQPDQPKLRSIDVLTRDGALTRLAHASEEADAISAVAPWGTTVVAKGFDATRETAMSPDVGQYQIVHLATHGVFSSDNPELSGIVLSMIDRDGVRVNGLMPLQDIYSLDLSTELIVLSACETGLGKDVKGEGLVGLTHGFLSAGAKTVVASLWKVDDRATARLMADFYQPMLQQDMSPAAALRAAKLKMMRDPRWSAPYYWAGFVLEGEYANHIAVDHHPWRRRGLVVSGLLLLMAGVLVVYKRRRRFFRPRST